MSRRTPSGAGPRVEPEQRPGNVLHCLSLAVALGLANSACGGDDTTAEGGGSIAGTVDGRTFSTVGAAYVIGQPDDPDRTTVVYVFDKPVACADLGSPGWDQRVADETQSLEMKVIGKSAAAYRIAADGTPSTGEADANYTLTARSGTPGEISATSGSVALASVTSQGPVGGSFDLTFPKGSLKGSFDGTWCAGGHEP